MTKGYVNLCCGFVDLLLYPLICWLPSHDLSFRCSEESELLTCCVVVRFELRRCVIKLQNRDPATIKIIINYDQTFITEQ